jgi:hypothetical protein
VRAFSVAVIALTRSPSPQVRSPPHISWAHAVNSLMALNDALVDAADNKVHIVEADVRMSARDPTRPMMAHDPGVEGDALDEWLAALLSANYKAVRRVGLKLDFKEWGAVVPALKLLLQQMAETNTRGTPLLLNADVLRGPNGGRPAIDPHRFVRECLLHHPQAVLSLGWTTGPEPMCTTVKVARTCGWGGGTELEPLAAKPAGDDKAAPAAAPAPARASSRRTCAMWGWLFPDHVGYSPEMVDEMLALCRRYQLTQVTFAVRGCYVEDSWTQLRRLLEAHPHYSLTIWSHRGDRLPSKDWMRDHVPAKRVFLDIPSARK